MGATTTEGTGLGSVENIVPKLFQHQISKEIIKIKQEVQKPIESIDGGELKILSLPEEDLQTILKAAEIIKKLMQ
jgi:hypothetical protein